MGHNRLEKRTLLAVAAATLWLLSLSTRAGQIMPNTPAVWNIHYVTNETKPLMTLYTGGGESLQQYQDFTSAMQTNGPSGLADAFDPGPSWGIWNEAQWQWLANNGYPDTTYSAIFLTNALSSDDQTLLSIMDHAGMFTAVQFGEWGYHFHNDKPYGQYDGYPVQETNKADCYNFLKSAYQQQCDTYRLGWANSVTGHSHYESYADEWGCRMGGIEVGENISFTQSKFAFTRGASRQWGIPWSVQVSPWWNGYVTTWQNLNYGHSLSLYMRLLSHGWFAGAAWLTPENNSAIIFNNGDPDQGTNAWGTAQAQLYAFINSHDRGIPYTPVAVVLDHLAGYNGYAHKAWGTLPFTQGDTEIDDLFVNQIFPNSDSIHYNPFPGDQELGYLRETPYGEMFDVLLSSASATNLSSYPVILLAGDFTFDDQFVANLRTALQNGSEVIMQPVHQAALGTNFAALTNAGNVQVIAPWTNPGTGRPAAVPNSTLADLAGNYLPIQVSGDPIQYSVNKNADGWVVELIHDNGVWKDPADAAIVTNSDIAEVTLTPAVSVTKASLWQTDANGNAADVDLNYAGAPITVPVGPGQCVYVQFTTATTNTLTININGTGSVQSGGSNAPSSITVPAGQTINLTAQGNFVAWTGCLTTNSANVRLVMTTNESITANFQDGSTPLAPFIVTQPVAKNVPTGGTLALSVAGYGIPAPTFSWFMGAQPVGNGTSNLTITNLTTNNQGSYSCVLSNSAGVVQSASVPVTVTAPAFITQPLSQSVVLGATATFTALANSSNVTYQWFKSTAALAGRTNTTLSIPNVQASNLGSYYVIITNTGLFYSATSAVVTLTDITRPVISIQPAGTNVAVGSNATLSITASGIGLSYFWKAGAAVLQSGTNNIYSVNTTHPGATNYAVVVSNLAGSVTSSSATVLVVGPPVFVSMPSVRYVGAGSNCVITAVCTNVAGTYSWFYNTNHPLSSTTASCTITNVTTNETGIYSLVLSNIAGLATDSVPVFVFSAPTIVAQPPATSVLPSGTNIDLTVTAYGNTLAYQWLKNGRAIAGATNTSLSFSNLVASNSANYSVLITNQVGKVTSHNSILTVIMPPTIATKPKSQSLVLSLPLRLTVLAAGTKPYTNLTYQWLFAGTNIANATNSTFSIANITTNWAGTFTVQVSNFGGTNSASATVTVLPDTSPPRLTITAPTKPFTNSPCNISGTGHDLVGITNLVFSLDGGQTFSNGTTANGWTNWTASVPAAVGTNTVMFVATDVNGLSATNSVKFKYMPFFSASVTIAGGGTGTAFGWVSQMQYGSTYTITAKAAAQNFFMHWSDLNGVITSSSTNSTRISFIVTNNVSATLWIATNNFFADTGSFNGLFYQSNTVTLDTAGFLHLALTTNLDYSGKVLFDGQSITISGQFDTNGNASIPLTSSVTMACALTNNQIVGTVNGSDWTANLTADLAQFSAANPATDFAGAYDIVIPPDTNGTASGYGFGSVSVSTAGNITFVGTAADGTSLSQTVPVSSEGYWPLFVQLYTYNKTNTAGALMGWVSFPTNGAPTGNVTWIKTPYNNLSPYANGLTNNTAILSSTYTAPTTGHPQSLPGLTTGILTFTGGNLSSNIVGQITQTNNGTIFYSTNKSIAMRFTGGGFCTGKFIDNGNGEQISFYGAVLQNSTNAFGYFLGTNNSGSAILTATP